MAATDEAYEDTTLEVEGARTPARHYDASGGDRAMLWVGGVGGGWDSPARGLYPDLAAELAGEGVASLRVKFRRPGDLPSCVADARAGVAFLAARGRERVGLCGHSFGGAAVVRAAAREPAVRTVVALATQAYGAEAVAELGPRCAVLLAHGLDDAVLPPAASARVHAWAREPKRLVLLPGAGHALDEAADEVRALVRGWIAERL